MRARLVVPLVGVLLALGTPSSPVTHGVMIPTHRITTGATEDSLNWSGYAFPRPTGHRITRVTSTFVVPTVSGTTPGFGSTWAGIGGFSSQDLIQAGVEEDYINGLGPTYNAWFEVLPQSETPIAGCSGDPKCTVRPGERVTVDIHTVGPLVRKQHWEIDIIDAGHWRFRKGIVYVSTYSSAEWILEAPTVGGQTVLPMMHTARFDPNNTSSLDLGPSKPIGARSHVRLTMNTLEGVPSALDRDGDGFNACAYATSCATPSS